MWPKSETSDFGWEEGGRLPSEHAASAIGVRALALVGDQGLDRGAAGVALGEPRLVVQPFHRAEHVLAPEPGVLDRGLEHRDGPVEDVERHRERMPQGYREKGRRSPMVWRD